MVARLANSVLAWKGQQYKEQVVPGYEQDLKPDLVIINKTTKEAYIVDVTMPFEGTEAFAAARVAKEQKYHHLKALLGSRGFQRVEIDAFIVGALGSWDPANDPVLLKLSIGRKYAKLFRQLCCTEAIKGSYCIWKNPPGSLESG